MTKSKLGDELEDIYLDFVSLSKRMDVVKDKFTKQMNDTPNELTGKMIQLIECVDRKIDAVCDSISVINDFADSRGME